MRRVALLALLAFPLAGAAQSPPVPPTPVAGQVTFANERLTAIDGFINAAECRAGTITLKWAVLYDTGKSAANLVGGSYQLYANNQPDAALNTGPCPTQDGDKTLTGMKAGPVSGRLTSDLTDPSQNLVFDTALIASVTGYGGCFTSDVVVQVCAQARDSSVNPIGTARGRLTISTTAPGAPTNVGATPGNNALNVSWTEPTGSPVAESYEIDATPLGTADPNGVRRSPRLTATSYRLGGLVTGETYSVVVRAYSTADNAGPDSTPLLASPETVLDFWGAYKDAGGRDDGGCGSGLAGPLALAGLAFALALARRRR
jgi:hypothetical protein